jgi:hypothetical protein
VDTVARSRQLIFERYSRGMHRALLPLAGAAILGVAATPGAPAVPVAPPTDLEAPAPTAVATPARAGARAALTLTLHYEMICGRPGRGPLVVTLPAAMRVPRAVSRAAVLLQGKPAPRVSVDGRTMTIAVPPPTGITCHSITMGTLTTTFTRAAGLANPASPGAYAVRAQIAGHAFTARLAIRA